MSQSPRSTSQTFSELELQPKHIAQVYCGVSYGGRARFYHPFDERLLKWDETALSTVQERDTANLEYEDSPIHRCGKCNRPATNTVRRGRRRLHFCDCHLEQYEGR